MSLIPRPPDDLQQRAIPVHRIASGESLYRFYATVHDPQHFGRSSRNRFDAPDGTFGVLYAGTTPAAAFAETFLRMPGRTILDPDFVDTRRLARFPVVQDISLVALTGSGLARLGATAAVVSSPPPYAVGQFWAKALFEHPAGVDGIAYRARHDDGEICVALFDRSASKVDQPRRHGDRPTGEDWFWALMDRYGVGVPPTLPQSAITAVAS